MASSAGALEPIAIPQSEFIKLTKIPIIIYYGDFIPKEPMANPGQDGWRVRLASQNSGPKPSTATVAMRR